MYKKIDKLISENASPKTIARSGRIILKKDSASVGLTDSTGKLTRAGKYYYEKQAKLNRTQASILSFL